VVDAPVREARLARLDETPGGSVEVAAVEGGSRVAFGAGALEAVTILVR
jgi:hypothetical protein